MRIPQTPPSLKEVLGNAEDVLELFDRLEQPETAQFIRRMNRKYVHWDKMRFYPMPNGIILEEMWIAVKFNRRSQAEPLPISFTDLDTMLTYWNPPTHLEWLHRIDQDAGGMIGSRTKSVIPEDNDQYLFNSLMEEAIASSQLEGATTTREIAKKMLRAKKKPRDKSQQMIMNNYNAILEIRDLKSDDLTPELLKQIQEIISYKTLENPETAGRFRNEDDPRVVVEDSMTQDVIHEPPSVHSVDYRIEELCDFANSSSGDFIHPVIKAIVLHFAIGYIHPFVDGNGRTARAIFYWYMLKRGYWIFEFLPISRIFLNAPIQYARAYLYTETDSGDLTYFIHYHLVVIDRAIRVMHEYFAKQQRDLKEAARYLKDIPGLNHRQMQIVSDSIQNPSTSFTIRQHAGRHNMTAATARSDLLDLENRGILSKTQDGKRWLFFPIENLHRRIKNRTIRPLTPKSKPKEPTLFPD